MSQTEAPAWLVPIVNEMLVAEANASSIPLTHLCNPHRKTKVVAQARWRIMRQLRRDYTLVGYCQGGIARGNEAPISYPRIAWLMDLDHSAIHRAVAVGKRERRNIEVDEAIDELAAVVEESLDTQNNVPAGGAV